ncbi:glycosyltransferase [Sneathiella limimaris]|uniref:glycosyltransferase n=1 Tax=Sneathiella limimaris TaxID=1964213 RepID=UPI00146B6598|nr:glycosyltransferase [Sneathiella limimaris]
MKDGTRVSSITRSFQMNKSGTISSRPNDITLTAIIGEMFTPELDRIRLAQFQKNPTDQPFQTTSEVIRKGSRFLKRPFLVFLNKQIQRLRKFMCGQSKGSLRFVRMIEILIFSSLVLVLIRKRRTKIWIAHDLYAIPVTWLLAKLTRGKFMYDAVEMSLGRQRKTPPGWLSRKIILWSEGRSRNADAVFVGCPYLKTEIDARNEINSTLILNGQLPEHAETDINLRKLLKIEDRPEFKIVIYVGFIAPGRGLEEFVEAVQYCKSKVVLVAMGPGPESYAGKLQILGDRIATDNCWVSLRKAVKEDFVVSICKQADVGISPVSREFGNGKYVLNNKLFQYMAAQIPILASDVPGVGGFVQREKIGLVFDERDPKDIARAIDDILALKAENKDLQKNVEETSLKYGWPAQKLLLLETFNSAVENPSGLEEAG